MSFNTVFLLSLLPAAFEGSCIILRHPPAGFTWGAAQDQSYNRNNGGVVCIDESLLSTLCRSNVIPATPTTAATRAESASPRLFRRGEGKSGAVTLNGGAFARGTTMSFLLAAEATIYDHLFNWFVKVYATNASR